MNFPFNLIFFFFKFRLNSKKFRITNDNIVIDIRRCKRIFLVESKLKDF